MIQDTAFFKRIFNGDKDLFRFMFLISGVPFQFNTVLPGVSVTRGMKKDCVVLSVVLVVVVIVLVIVVVLVMVMVLVDMMMKIVVACIQPTLPTLPHHSCHCSSTN